MKKKLESQQVELSKKLEIEKRDATRRGQKNKDLQKQELVEKEKEFIDNRDVKVRQVEEVRKDREFELQYKVRFFFNHNRPYSKIMSQILSPKKVKRQRLSIKNGF